jgi:hypothetical protein
VDFGFHLAHRQVNLSGPGGIYISLTFLIAVAISIHWIFALGVKKGGSLNYFPSITNPSILFIFVGVLSMINTSDKFRSVSGIFHYAKGLLVYFITANRVKNEDDVKLAIRALLIALILGGLVYLAQNIMRIGVSRGDEIIFRGKGTIGSPSVMATFLSSGLLMALGGRFIKIRSSIKTLALVAFFTGIPALILTFVRASYISFSLSMILGIGYGLKRKWVRPGTIVALLVAVGIAVPFLWPMISHRLSADHAAALEERINLMKIA